MLTIRLRRKGKKNQPFFRVIVVDKRRSSVGGRAVEIVGNIDPLTKRKNLKKDRILYWISKGAKPSDTVHNMLVSEKIIDAKKIDVSKKPKKSAQGGSASGGKPAKDSAAPAAAGAANAQSPAANETPTAAAVEAQDKPAETPIPAETPKEEKPVDQQKPETPVTPAQ